MEYGAGYGQPAYGYSSQSRASSGASSSVRSSPSGYGGGYGAPSSYAVPQQQQQPQQHPSPAVSRHQDRSAQINDYVAKQKAAKLNAPLIKKENQRLAEARAMSASRSKASDHSEDYAEDHSHLAPPDDYRPSGRPVSGMRPTQSAQPDATRRQSTGAVPARSTGIPSSAPRTVSYESDRDSSGGGGGGSNAELVKRVILLEDQIRLLKQQNRIFLSFMQNTESQLAELRTAQSQVAATPAESRSRSRAGESAPSSASSYPNNMSQGTKQVLQRSQSERNTQPPPTASASSSRQPPARAVSPSVYRNGSSGGGSSGPVEIDQTFAPLEDEAERRERMRSAKKKAGLLNLRDKMAQKEAAAQMQQQQQQQQQSQQQYHQEDSRGRGYQANSYQEYDQTQGGYQQQPSARQQPQPRVAPAPAQRAPQAAATRAPPPQQPAYHDDDGYGGGGGGYGDYGGGGDPFGDGASGVPPGADEEVETFPCPNCERRFNAAALQKHVAKQICKQKPRKVFNMAQKRLEDLASEAREAGIKLPTKPVVAGAPAPKTARGGEQPVKKQAKWRVDHEKFMAAIKAGKQLQAAVASGVPLSSLPPPPATREEDDDRTPCPHCGRKFSSNVAERHIPHCKNTKNRPKANVASAARLGNAAAAAKRW